MPPKYESNFTQRVIEAIEHARMNRGMSVQELIEKSGIRRSSYFRKMRGETTFTTEDVDTLARAMDMDPMLLLTAAVNVGGTSDTSDPRRQRDFARVADEINENDESGEDNDTI